MNKEEIDIWFKHFANRPVCYLMFDENGKEIKISFYRVLLYMRELEAKVNQLETNRDEAIEEIKYFELQADHLDDSIYLDKTLSNKLISILERGKE